MYLSVNKISNIILLTLSVSCSSTTIDRLKNVGKAPDLNTVEYPMNRPTYQPVIWPEQQNKLVPNQSLSVEKQAPKLANSLWQPGARTFFRDQRARRVGDILKVSVNIKDTASWSNKTEQIRTTTEASAAPAIFGFEKRLKNVLRGVDPTKLFSATGNDDLVGKGTIDRSEALKMQFSAIVTQILPNGNLVIQGHQEVRVNFELRELTIEGIVRPEDITSDNLVSSDQIAEARISYGGRGNVTNLQQPRIGNQIMDIINPF